MSNSYETLWSKDERILMCMLRSKMLFGYFENQPERLSPKGFQRNGANQNIDKDYVDMVKGISPDLLGSSDSPNSANK